MKKHWQCIGPILLSALSLFISFFVIKSIASVLVPGLNLLSSRGTGKIIFISMVIYQIILFLSVQPYVFLKQFFHRTIFFNQKNWLSQFSLFFVIFFSLHALLLFVFYHIGYIQYRASWGVINGQLVGKTFFGLFVVFMLAWTEELIFRGTIYPYLAQYYRPAKSLILTSLIFMLVHNLKNPLTLVTTQWQLGLGLFLLGVLLNQVFVITKKLYTGMGVHAGLVFVKVILRRAPFLANVPDLRQLHIVHILFSIVIISLFIKYRDRF